MTVRHANTTAAQSRLQEDRGMPPINRLEPSMSSVTSRLWVAVGVVILALAGLVGFAGWRSESLQRASDIAAAQLLRKQKAVEKWAVLASGAALRMQAAAISADPSVNEAYREELAAIIREVGELKQALAKMPLTADDRGAMALIGETGRAVGNASEQIIAQRSAGRETEAQKELRSVFNPAVSAYMKAIVAFAALQEGYRVEMEAKFAARRSSIPKVALGVTSLIALALLGGTFWLVNSIKLPLRQAMNAADRIAGGDLSVSIDVLRKDEFGHLLSSLDGMATQLRSLVAKVRDGVGAVSGASSEIAAGNIDLSGRTELAASHLQRIASSLEQLTAAVTHSAETAREAAKLAQHATASAQRGGLVVEQVTESMQAISASSQRIGDIIGTIDGIAFQTNILALNAAVEAARAGEQGRGFAVVAGEVRSLAHRSAEAAKEIKHLIQSSAERVEAGASLVTQAGSVMQEAVGSVGRVSILIGEIASGANDQRDGIARITVAVSRMDGITQQNAALVEQSAAAAISLQGQAERLDGLVTKFHLASAG